MARGAVCFFFEIGRVPGPCSYSTSTQRNLHFRCVGRSHGAQGGVGSTPNFKNHMRCWSPCALGVLPAARLRLPLPTSSLIWYRLSSLCVLSVLSSARSLSFLDRCPGFLSAMAGFRFSVFAISIPRLRTLWPRLVPAALFFYPYLSEELKLTLPVLRSRSLA